MPEQTQAFRINEPKVVSETLDGEAILIDLETGNYYSMNASGSMVWDLLLLGQPVHAIVESASQRYGADTATAGPLIDAFVDQLLASGLIVANGIAAAEPPAAWTGLPEAFVAPAMERYDDMQEMLLADPIHDVAQAGWPNRL
jgi:hypothetical protein